MRTLMKVISDIYHLHEPSAISTILLYKGY